MNGSDGDLGQHMKAVVLKLFGEANHRLSKGHKLRFGTNGSLSIDLRKGTFYSHEDNVGGGVLDLIKREKDLNGKDAVAWMRRELGVDIPDDAGTPDHAGTPRKIVATYDYIDTDGTFLFQVVRYDPKDFRQRRRDGAGDWDWSTKGVKQVPYRLPDLNEAIGRGLTVIIVEGEKVADSLWALNIPATCNAGGAGKWSPALNHYFRGADVVISPDNDPPARNPDGTLRLKEGRPIFAGQDHARDVARKLYCDADRIRILELPGLPPKGDAFDWIAAGGKAEQFWQLVETQAVPHNKYEGPTAESAEKDNSAPLVITLAEFLAKFRPPDYLVEALLQRGFFYALTGMTGGGKTAVATLLAVVVSIRKPAQKFGPHAVKHGRVVYIAAENETDVQMRFPPLLMRFGVEATDLDLLVIDQVFDLEKDFARVEREIHKFGDVDLVIVDTSPRLFTGDNMNDDKQMLDHAVRVRGLTGLPGRPCVVALGHPIKHARAPTDLLPKGGGAYLNECDGNLTLWKHDGHFTDLHWTGKFRGPDFEPVTFQLNIAHSTANVDNEGKILPTVAATYVTEAEVEAVEAGAAQQEDQLLAAVHSNPRGSLADWATSCGWSHIKGNDRKPNKQLAQRVADRLVKTKLLAKDNRDYVLTEKGKRALKKKKTVPEDASDDD
jgi:hypothetical protein